MKSLYKIIVSSALFIGLAVGCKDEALDPYIRPNGSAHGFGQFVSIADGALLPGASGFYDQTAVDRVVFFDEKDQSRGFTYKLQWISIDNRVNISAIELYVEFNESYSDADRNPLIAKHGGASKGPSYPEGKFWKTINPTGARAAVDISLTPADIYDLFKDNTFDYDGPTVLEDGVCVSGCNPAESVFGVPLPTSFRSLRTVANKRFFSDRTITLTAGEVALAADQFRIRWRLIGDDDAAYGSWSASVCQETVGINCNGQWRVNKDVFNPKATITRLDKVLVDRNADKKLDAADNKRSFIAGDQTTYTIKFDRAIASATPPSVSLSGTGSGPFGTLGTLTPVAGSDNKEFTIDYTAPANFTGTAILTTQGAISSGSAPVGGLEQVKSETDVVVDNTPPVFTAISGLTTTSTTVRVGRGGSTTIVVTFNEALSTISTNDAPTVSITGQQGLDDVTNAKMTVAANGLTATYLYLWKDSNAPFDNTHGVVTVAINGGKDVAGNAFAGTTGNFVNDVGAVVTDPTLGNISAVAASPSATFVADLGTQLRWSITQTALAPSSSTVGTWFWVAVTSGAPAPGQKTVPLTGVPNPVYNGFDLSTIPPADVIAQGSTTTVGTNFTGFTANGTFDVYMYFVSLNNNRSANSKVLTGIEMK